MSKCLEEEEEKKVFLKNADGTRAIYSDWQVGKALTHRHTTTPSFPARAAAFEASALIRYEHSQQSSLFPRFPRWHLDRAGRQVDLKRKGSMSTKKKIGKEKRKGGSKSLHALSAHIVEKEKEIEVKKQSKVNALDIKGE